MSGLISEIQRSCLNGSVPVDALLRQVKLAAVKLKLGELEDWVDSELNGYRGELPAHRILRGEPAGWNPYHGWVPVETRNAEIADFLATARVQQGIAGLHDLITTSEGGDGYHFPLPLEVVIKLNIQTSRVVIQVPRGGIVGILNFVRNKVLDWAIAMERNGVIGEGFSFDAQEVESAKTVMTTFNIGKIDNFAGNMGTGNTSGDINVTSSQVIEIKEIMLKLREAAPSLVDAGADDSLSDIIDAVIVEADKLEPESGRLRGLTQDVRAALAGAAGNLTAEGAMSLVATVMRLLGGA